MKNIRVRNIMATKYASISPSQTIVSAAEVLLEYRQSAAPVVNEHKELVGILSEADCMRETLIEGYFNEGATIVSDLMTSPPDTISPEAELSSVAETFWNNRRRLMPVVEAGTLVGILDRQNILKALVDHAAKVSHS
jgi:CBS domain-containing protein